MKSKLLLVIILCLILFTNSFATEKNLFVDSEDSFDGMNFVYDKGILTNGMLGTGTVYISVPGLTKNYTFKGHVKIVEISSQPWNGIRVIIGADSYAAASKFVVTKDWGTRVEFKMNNMNDLMGPSGKLSEETEFDYEVVRTGQHYVFKINGALCLEGELPEEFDAFEEGYEFNLGFESSECLYEVTQIEIYCAEAPEITASPEPSPTPVSASPEPTSVETTASTTNKPKAEDNDSKIDPIVIAVCVVAVIAIGGVVFVTIKDKKKKR